MFMPRRKTEVHIALIIALLVMIAELASTEHTLAQAIAYKLTELAAERDSGQIPWRLNNLDDLLGRACNLGGGTGAATWGHGTLRSRHWGVLAGVEYSSASVSTTREVAGVANIAKSDAPEFIGNYGPDNHIAIYNPKKRENC
jgi:hypothetical protein